MTVTARNTNQLQVIVTHVHHGGNGTGTEASSTVTMGQTDSKLEKFRKGHPKALGTVQIMIGVVMLLIGIVIAVNGDSFAVLSGTSFWASMIYIATGSLAIASDNKLNTCLVNATLGMSVIACIAAGIGIIFYSADTAGVLLHMSCYRYGGYSSQYDDCVRYQQPYKVRSTGIAGVMLVLTILEFIVSICMSSFACKATCNTGPQPVYFIGSDILQSSIVAEGPATPLMDHQVHQKDQPPGYFV